MRQNVLEAPARRAPLARTSDGVRFAWWWPVLLATICLEGLARRYLPVPGPILYFAKDAVLLLGLVTVGVDRVVAGTALRLAGPIVLFIGGTALCCALSIMDPGHPSLLLGVLGSRQYLLWWIAPLLVATALKSERIRLRSERSLAFLALAVCAFAAYQFGQPPTAQVNAYAWGDETTVIAGVSSTGRVRVSSTFSYISGFADFATLGVPLLLASAVHSRDRRGARLAYIAAGGLVAAAPMSGSRATVLYVVLGGLAVLALSGSLRRKSGWVTLAGVTVIGVAGYLAAPDAVHGVQDRFDSDDTSQRFRGLALALPIYTVATTDYPLMGAGVGVLQNAGAAIQIQSTWQVESEPQRVLIELGLVGYLLVWFSRAALAVALIRGGRVFKRAGQPAWFGAAWTYAALAMLLPLSTDHVAQALLFSGTGLMLARMVAASVPATTRARHG